MFVASCRLTLFAAILLQPLACGAQAAGEVATAKIKLADGKDAGIVTMMEAVSGVLIKYDLNGLPPGPHAVHIYEKGTCDGDFSSAGGIYNPLGAKHGFLHDEGPMSGDLPNVHVAADGKAVAEVISPFLTLNKDAEETLFDADGSAVVIFEKPDDYETEPDGGGGARIACGAIVAK